MIDTFKEERLFKFFLINVFLCNIIPANSGFKIIENGPLINAQKILDLILFIAVLLNSRKNKLKFNDINLLFTIFISSRFISVFYSDNFRISIQYWLNAILTVYIYYFVAIRLINSIQKINRVVKVLFYTGLITAFSNYFEFITRINVAHLFPNVSNTLDFWIYDRFNIIRVFGLKEDPVITAYYLTFTLPFGIYLFHNEDRIKWLYLTVIGYTALFLNLTRVSVVAVIVMFFIYSSLISKKKIVKNIFLSILVIFLVLNYSPAMQFFYNIISLTKKNEIEGFDFTRIYGFLDILPHFIKNIPFWGIGPGSLVRGDLMLNYFNKIGYLYSQTSIRTELPFFITILIDSGYIASLSFLLLLINVIKKSFAKTLELKNRQTKIESYLSLVFIVCLISITSNGIFDAFSIIYLMIGMMNVCLNKNCINSARNGIME